MTQKSSLLRFLLLLCTCASFLNCKEAPKTEATSELIQYEETESDLPISNLNLPDGFKIEVYAHGLNGARSMAMGDEGTLFVGTRNDKTVYAVQDLDKDYKADHIKVLDKNDGSFIRKYL